MMLSAVNSRFQDVNEADDGDGHYKGREDFRMCQESGRGKALPSYAEGRLQLVEALSRLDMLMNGEK
jgi:hypothetical protein